MNNSSIGASRATTDLRVLTARLAISFSAVAAIALAGCGSSNDEASSAPSSSTTAPVSTSADLEVASTSLGNIVVDSSGKTLYAYTKDSKGTSNCYDACAAAWPPALTDDSTPSVEGVSSSLVGTTQRKDGSMQLTVNGMPMYRFAADADAGDVSGQGNKDVWYVVDANGNLVRKADSGTSSTTSTTSKKDSGYNY